MKVSSLFLSIGLALLLGDVAAAQASFTLVPASSNASDITADGKWVVGTGFSNGGYRWDWRNSPTVEELDTNLLLGISRPAAVSADGSIVLADISDDDLVNLPGGTGSGSQVAGIWRESTNSWESLGYLPAALSCPSRSSAYDITADGSAAVGLSWDGCNGRAFYWTQPTGMTELQVVGDARNRASTIAADGSVIGGFAQGNFSRTPAFWFPDGTGQVIDMDATGEFYGASADGSYLYGVYDGDAIKFEVATQAITILGTGQLTSGWSGIGLAADEPCLEADRTIVGFDSLLGGTNAWAWNEVSGMLSLNDILATAGVPGVPALGAPQGITADGTTVVGSTFLTGGWVLELPTGVATINSGCGGNPAGSLEVLCGQPRLGTSMVIGLQNPLGSMGPGALSRLTFSLGQFSPACGPNLPGYGMAFNGAPGELIITLPKILTVAGAPWDGGNPAAVPVVIPSNPPLHGVTVYAQGALVDVAGGVHIGLTEGLELTFGGW